MIFTLAFTFLALLVCVGVPVASAMRELPKPAARPVLAEVEHR